MKNLPVIAITMGDPAGIGAEIILKALEKREIFKYSIPIIIGDKKFLKKTADSLNISPLPSNITIIDFKNIPKKFIIGRPTRVSGKAAVEYIKSAVSLAKDKKVDAIVTAPISKEAIQMAGYKYPGHTEMLAELTDTKNYAMMLTGKKIRVVLVTTHTAVKNVSRLITRKKILKAIRLTDSALKSWGFLNPRIGVSALNPHGGEGGIFGDEEIKIIMPAINDARSEGIDVNGPFPADTLFTPSKRANFDAIVVMYHDQGLIPIKMSAFGKAVNITLGLPFIRTSVDHGTAYDIAGKNLADPSSLIEAVKLAAKLTKVNITHFRD
ncbi:MAG: 4-hydroxythreonine-4-phosphate dehydrogenase PdxA [Nitrospinae bacterium]|nr:4-hydroxythreonine-4-phosphate dehydrogenase PdxA [Nitrospinota bacterium]